MNDNKRTENSLKNSIAAVISNILVMVLGFVIQTVFLKTLGEEYLGINGLFNNIISMLAIVELGIGPAIVSNLYKPLADGDQAHIKSLMAYYRKWYNIIGVLVMVIGALVMPFLNLFVKTEAEITTFGGIYLIFALFVLDSAFSYFYSYKRSLIQADQKNRIINITHLICYFLMIAFQIAVLYLTRNFILFLIIKLFFRVLENLILSAIVDRDYPYLKGPAEAISAAEKENVFTKVKGMIYHKVGGYIVLGTANIIISAFLGVAMVGRYSNYYLIINSLYILYCQIFAALTASVGNLLATESKEANFAVYKKIMFLNFWIYGFSSAALFAMMDPFVTVWLGEEFLLPMHVLGILTVNFYMLGMRSSIGTFKDAAGIFYEDRFIPVLESIINIVVAVVCVHFFGLFGVFFGTFISSFIVVFYSLPKYVFKKVFDRPIRDYMKLYFKYILVTLAAVAVTWLASKGISSLLPDSNLLTLAVATLVSLVVPNLLFLILFGRTEEFEYYKNFALRKLRRK